LTTKQQLREFLEAHPEIQDDSPLLVRWRFRMDEDYYYQYYQQAMELDISKDLIPDFNNLIQLDVRRGRYYGDDW